MEPLGLGRVCALGGLGPPGPVLGMGGVVTDSGVLPVLEGLLL